jgi:hypothetical protein
VDLVIPELIKIIIIRYEKYFQPFKHGDSGSSIF